MSTFNLAINKALIACFWISSVLKTPTRADKLSHYANARYSICLDDWCVRGPTIFKHKQSMLMLKFEFICIKPLSQLAHEHSTKCSCDRKTEITDIVRKLLENNRI